MLVFLRIPNAAIYSSGIRPARTQTVSRFPDAESSENIGKAVALPFQITIGKSRVAPLLPSHRRATRSRSGPSA